MKADEEVEFLLSCIFCNQMDNNFYEAKQIFKNIISKISLFNTCNTLAFLYSNYQEPSKKYDENEKINENDKEIEEDFSLQFIKAAHSLGFIKETQMNEYCEILLNLGYAFSYSSENDKLIQYKDPSFSFNPFKNIKSEDTKKSNFYFDLETPNLIKSETKSEKNEKSDFLGSATLKNDLTSDFGEKGELIPLSPSSYSGFLNSHDSSFRNKGLKEEDFLNNMILVEKEH